MVALQALALAPLQVLAEAMQALALGPSHLSRPSHPWRPSQKVVVALLEPLQVVVEALQALALEALQVPLEQPCCGPTQQPYVRPHQDR